MDVISFDGLLKKSIPPVEYLVGDIIPKSSLIYLYGPSGTFKTSFLLYTVINGSMGKDVFDYKVEKPFKTLWIDEENREVGMKHKLNKLINGMKVDLSGNYFMICNEINILNKEHINEIEKIIKERDIDLLVIDSLTKVFPGRQRDEDETKFIFTRLNPLMVKYGVSIVVIAHSRKLGKDQIHRTLEDLSGSKELGAQSDGALLMYKYETNGYRLQQTKNRHAEETEPINFEVNSDDDSIEIRYLGLASDNIEAHNSSTKASHYILGFMKPGKEYTFAEIQEECNKVRIMRTSAYEGLKKLVKDNRVDKPRRDCYLLPN